MTEKSVKNSFRKSERLNSKKAIGQLYQSGRKFSHGAIFAVYILTPAEKGEAKVLISVPKRLMKKAVDRNYAKRLIREAYRQNKHTLTERLSAGNLSLNLALHLTHRDDVCFEKIKQDICHIIRTLEKRVDEKAS